ncbi:MAG TPA: radical SAM protein, partial [Blastocatellia bacterium]
MKIANGNGASTNSFESKLSAHGLSLTRGSLQTLQINVGRKCNQACHHCHVEAGPSRAEMMSAETARRIGEWIQSHRPAVVDITG